MQQETPVEHIKETLENLLQFFLIIEALNQLMNHVFLEWLTHRQNLSCLFILREFKLGLL